MTSPKYLTLAPDLIEHADRFMIHLRDDGYSVKPEATDISFPSRPSLLGSRSTTRYFVEVNSSCPIEILLEWARYAKMRRQPTFVSLVVPHGTTVSGKDIAQLREAGIGYYMSNEGGIAEILAPRDLGVTISLPTFASLPISVQRKLKAPYRKFESGDYVGGFKDACQALEDDARERMKADVATTRIRFVRNGKPIVRTNQQIDRLTLGQLAVAHEEIVAPNQDDTLIGKAIAAVNKDRVKATHKTNDARAMARVRENVSKNMWTVVAAMKAMNPTAPKNAAAKKATKKATKKAGAP